MNDKQVHKPQTAFDLPSAVRCLKVAILQTQHTIAAEANRVMLMLYLGIGRFVSTNTRQGTWGTGGY